MSIQKELFIGQLYDGQNQQLTEALPDDLPAYEDVLGADVSVLRDAAEIVPVIAGPCEFAKLRSRDHVDGTAFIVTGDVSDDMSLSPFERTQREYSGHDSTALSVVDFDDDRAQ